MSRKTINAILGLATIDEGFSRELLKNPLVAVEAQGFQLTPEEQEIFHKIRAKDLQEFSQCLLQALSRK